MEPLRRPADTAVRFVRHCPEETLLYQLVERHYPAYLKRPAGARLP